METPLPRMIRLAHPNSPRILPFAMAVGLMVFFITGDLEGGLSDIQGFFIGVAIVILLKVVVIIWPSRRREAEPEVATYKLETVRLEQDEKFTSTIDDISRAIVKKLLLATAAAPTTVTIKSFQDKEAAVIQIQTKITQAGEGNG